MTKYNPKFPYYDDDSDYKTNANSYYKYLGRKNKLIKLLAKRIWEYDERLDNRLEELENVLNDYLSQWDERIENLDDEVSHIFIEWLNDGTLEQIINNDVLGNKADKSFVDTEIERLDIKDENLTTQLAQKAHQDYIDVRTFGVVGDGVTDDTQAFQEAFDYAILNNKHLWIGVDINIEGTIYIDKSVDDRKATIVTGTGSIIKRNKGFLFDSHLNTAGNIRFQNIRIESETGTGTKVARHKLMRMYFTGVDFYSVDSYSDFDTTSEYLQTIYFNDCTVVGGSGWFIRAKTAYDISFTHSVMEHREHGFNIIVCHSVRITDNVIEGMDGKVYEGNAGGHLKISENYFEANTIQSNESYIIVNSDFNKGVAITDNFFLEGVAEKPENFAYIQIQSLNEDHTITGNSFDRRLIKVVRHRSITPKFLDIVMENTLRGSDTQHVINDYPLKSTLIGSGNLFPNLENPVTNSGVLNGLENFPDNSIHTQEDVEYPNSLFMRTRVSGDTSGFLRTTDTAYLKQNVDYVIGLVGTFWSYGETYPSIVFKIIHIDSGDGVAMEWKGQSDGTKTDNFVSLPSFKVSKSGEYELQISFKENGRTIGTSDAFILRYLFVQAGNIAQPTLTQRPTP